MNNTTSKFKYLWNAVFKKKVIKQHPLDLYSKHNPDSEYNPSSFRDFQEYFDEHRDELEEFNLYSPDLGYKVVFTDRKKPKIIKMEYNRWGNLKYIELHREKRELTDVRPIYYRKMEATIVNGAFGEPRVAGYCIGYQGIDNNGNNRQKIINVV